MEIDSYSSQTEVLPTFSLFLALLAAGLNLAPRVANTHLGEDMGIMDLPASSRYAYYEPVERVSEMPEQAKALRQFAENLIELTEDNPQVVTEVLNRHFWDLV